MEEGYKVVIGVKAGTRDSWLMARSASSTTGWCRRCRRDVELVQNFTGFGLYDREVVELFRGTDEQYPYLRGLICDFGFEMAEIDYRQPPRAGHTKNNFFTPLRHRDAGDH